MLQNINFKVKNYVKLKFDPKTTFVGYINLLGINLEKSRAFDFVIEHRKLSLSIFYFFNV